MYFITHSLYREEVGLFDVPQKSRERNPPFSIEVDFTQYRRGRDYTVSILTENYFDAFIIQVRPWLGRHELNIDSRPVVLTGLMGMPLLLGSGRRCPASQSISSVLVHDDPRESNIDIA